MNIISSINGKKTYIIGAVTILYAVTAYILGKVDGNAAVQLIDTSLLAMGIRHGIK